MSVARDEQVSLATVTTQPEQSDTVSDAAVVGGSTRYALAKPRAPRMRTASKPVDLIVATIRLETNVIWDEWQVGTSECHDRHCEGAQHVF